MVLGHHVLNSFGCAIYNYCKWSETVDIFNMELLKLIFGRVFI